jgi:hypothetical protein
MAQSALYQYGMSHVQDYKSIRTILSIELNENKTETEYITGQFISFVQQHCKLHPDQYRYEIVERSSEKGFSMKWHIDDKIVVKRPYNPDTDISLNETYQLCNRSMDTPVYSSILYLSTYGEDFTGGAFEFVDKVVYPKKHTILFFDSREVHRVQPLTSGIRQTILCKWYKIK